MPEDIDKDKKITPAENAPPGEAGEFYEIKAGDRSRHEAESESLRADREYRERLRAEAYGGGIRKKGAKKAAPPKTEKPSEAEEGSDDSEKNEKKSVSGNKSGDSAVKEKGLFGEALTAPILLLVMLALLLCTRLLDVRLLEYRDNIYLSVIILHLLIFMLPAIFYCKLKGAGYSAQMNLRFFRPGMLPFSFAALFVMLSGGLLVKLAMFRLGVYSGEYQVFADLIPTGGGTVSDTAYAVLACAVLPAVCEEFVFRSVLLTEYSRYGAVCAVVVTSVMYVFPGFRPLNIPLTLFCGVVLGASACVTRSVAAPILIRVLYNLAELFAEPQLSAFFRQTANLTVCAFILVILFCFFLFLTFGEAERIYYLYALTRPDDSPPAALPLGRRLTEALLSPTLLLCLGLYIAALLIRK